MGDMLPRMEAPSGAKSLFFAPTPPPPPWGGAQKKTSRHAASRFARMCASPVYVRQGKSCLLGYMGKRTDSRNTRLIRYIPAYIPRNLTLNGTFSDGNTDGQDPPRLMVRLISRDRV